MLSVGFQNESHKSAIWLEHVFYLAQRLIPRNRGIQTQFLCTTPTFLKLVEIAASGFSYPVADGFIELGQLYGFNSWVADPNAAEGAVEVYSGKDKLLSFTTYGWIDIPLTAFHLDSKEAE